jgi:threonine dehydratase
MMHSYLHAILNAHVYDVAKETPLEWAPRLSARLGRSVFLKREDLQSVFSFKLRGAYNKMSHLTDEERQAGVIAASAGNHAQGVALASQKLGIKALIVMPKTTPQIKVKAVQYYGATTLLHGDSYDDAYAHARQLGEDKKLTFIHPYDDPLVIAGQGTVGAEILHQYADPIEAIFIPVGGGGLLAGVAAYVKAVRPEIRIIAVEPEDAACLKAALEANSRVVLDQVGLFADGVAVRQIGEEPFKVAQLCVNEVVTVTTDEICAGIKDVFEETRAIVEPAGALAVAAMKKYAQKHPDGSGILVGINSGANMNFDRLRYVAERAELGEHREAVLAVTIPERPGSFKAFCTLLGKRSLTEFNYRFSGSEEAHVFVGLELQRGVVEKQEVMHLLDNSGYPVIDLTDNEMAKLHVRYMVGGRVPSLAQERVFRVEFPERPGALLQFLSAIGSQWNITLFHYRNHGAAYGRVLIGLDVSAADSAQVNACLDALGYPYVEETTNDVYRLFL